MRLVKVNKISVQACTHCRGFSKCFESLGIISKLTQHTLLCGTYGKSFCLLSCFSQLILRYDFPFLAFFGSFIRNLRCFMSKFSSTFDNPTVHLREKTYYFLICASNRFDAKYIFWNYVSIRYTIIDSNVKRPYAPPKPAAFSSSCFGHV